MTGGRLSVYLTLVVVVGCVVMLGELSSGSKNGAQRSRRIHGLLQKAQVGRLPWESWQASASWRSRRPRRHGHALCSASSSSSSAWTAFAGQGTAFFGFLLYDYGGMLFFHVLSVIINILIVMGGVESA